MALSTQTFRIYVSSTSNDLKAERNALQEHLFQHQRALCQLYEARFQPIKFCWGSVLGPDEV